MFCHRGVVRLRCDSFILTRMLRACERVNRGSRNEPACPSASSPTSFKRLPIAGEAEML